MSREAAGAAIRALRESRGLSLAELAAATEVSIMGLSYLERGARKPHRGTVQKVENGLGLPPGTYSRLLVADDPDEELSRLMADAPAQRAAGPRSSGPIVVKRQTGTQVLEAYSRAQIEGLHALIERLPAPTANEYEVSILFAIDQCVKFEMLAAESWRTAVDADDDSAHRLMDHIRELEATRRRLLNRIPHSLTTRFDDACAQSDLPEAVIAEQVGISVDEMWAIRNRGSVPQAALSRVQAFVAAAEGGAREL